MYLVINEKKLSFVSSFIFYSCWLCDICLFVVFFGMLVWIFLLWLLGWGNIKEEIKFVFMLVKYLLLEYV